MADTGHGSSVAFATSSFSANITSIEFDDVTRAAVPTTHLGTTGGRTYVPGDVTESGGVTLTIQYDPDTQPPYNGVAETVTITFPLPAGDSTSATAAVSGFVDSWSPPSLNTDALMESTIHVKASGDWTFVDAT